MATDSTTSSFPMSSAPMRYGPDGSVDWGTMWDSFCALAQEGGPPHRGAMLRAPDDADPSAPAYQSAVAEIARGIALVSDLRASAASPGWLAVACESDAMAAWLAGAIEAERVQARSDGATLYVPVGEWSDVTKEIKNIITVVAKTTHYWAEHVPAAPDGSRHPGAYRLAERRHVQRVHTQDVVLDIGGDVGSLVIYTSPELCAKEIELVRKGDPARRTHVDVAERRFNGRTIHAAVYPPVPAGDYALWLDYTTPAGEITIVGGEVAQLDWRA